jgi:rubrerythrin
MLQQLTLRKAIEFAATTEAQGADFYRRMAAKFAGDPAVEAVFSQLARDEEVHRAQFGKLLEGVPASYDDEVEYERAQYLRAMAISEFFSPTSGRLRNADQIKDAGEALLNALELEKATLGYYRAMRDELGNNEALNAIIETEKQHLVRLMKVITTGAKFRGLQDDWP